MKNTLTKALSLILTACFIMSLCVCTTAMAAEQIASKSLKFFDEETWSTYTNTYTGVITYPEGIDTESPFTHGGGSTTYKAEKSTGTFGKATEDASFMIYAKNGASANRTMFTNLYYAGSNTPNNVASGDKYTIYVDMATSKKNSGLNYHGLRLTSQKNTNASNNTTTTEFIRFVEGGVKFKATQTANEKTMTCNAGEWNSYAVEITINDQKQGIYKTYMNGKQVTEGTIGSFLGIVRIQAGFEILSTATDKEADLYIDNFAIYAGEAFSTERYNEIKAAKERHIEVDTLAKDKKVKFYAYVDNAESATKDVAAFAAVYDNSGKLIEVAKADKQLAASKNGQGAGVTLTLSKEAAEYANAKVAGFIWEKGTLTPIGAGSWYPAQ